jgi:hypothetical protein
MGEVEREHGERDHSAVEDICELPVSIGRRKCPKTRGNSVHELKYVCVCMMRPVHPLLSSITRYTARMKRQIVLNVSAATRIFMCGRRALRFAGGGAETGRLLRQRRKNSPAQRTYTVIVTVGTQSASLRVGWAGPQKVERERTREDAPI